LVENFFSDFVAKRILHQYVCISIVEQRIAETIYKEARRDRLYEALATWPNKEKVLNPDPKPG
jgi:hypothetical protein